MKPLFMWAGGKTRMIKKYGDHLPNEVAHYVEPFLGAGAMFVWAYKKNPNASFVLNDSNESIISIYECIKQDCKMFIERLDELSAAYLPLDKENRKKFYYELRRGHAFDFEDWTKTYEAATLYFLMKTGFNGIWQINKNTNNRFGTPSGLLNQKDKVYDKDNLLEWHEALQKCTLTSGDFSDTLGHVTDKSYVFLDPPYRGSFTQYGVDFDDALQEGVIQYLNECGKKGAYAMMSNRDIQDGFFESRAGNNEIVYFDVTYTAGRRKKNEDGTHSAKKAREILMIANRGV
jgi:DNA adenine methylase